MDRNCLTMLAVAGNAAACSHHQSSISTDDSGTAIFWSNSVHSGGRQKLHCLSQCAQVQWLAPISLHVVKMTWPDISIHTCTYAAFRSISGKSSQPFTAGLNMIAIKKGEKHCQPFSTHSTVHIGWFCNLTCQSSCIGVCTRYRRPCGDFELTSQSCRSAGSTIAQYANCISVASQIKDNATVCYLCGTGRRQKLSSQLVQ